VWDVEEDEWFCDAAVVFDFEGRQLELDFLKLSSLSLTWDEIDLVPKPDWYGSDFVLEWRADVSPEVEVVRGQVLEDIGWLEYRFETTVLDNPSAPGTVGQKNASWLLHGIEFKFEAGFLAIFNGLDKNALTSKRDEGPEFRRESV
jgi:hypothetical protein